MVGGQELGQGVLLGTVGGEGGDAGAGGAIARREIHPAGVGEAGEGVAISAPSQEVERHHADGAVGVARHRSAAHHDVEVVAVLILNAEIDHP